MNKELIKKYKKEFEHWLDGGTLLGRRWVSDVNNGDESFTIWYNIDSYSTWMMKDLLTKPQNKLELIINDEYAKLRKAEAEGKTIQIKLHRDGNFMDIKDNGITPLNKSIEAYPHFSPSRYRIKPEEPEFKVGDWVREYDKYSNGTDIIQIDEALLESIVNENTYNTFELWQPKEDEWCWNKTFGLVKFLNIYEKISYREYTVYSPFFKEKYNVIALEPHIGELPSFLKNSK